MKIILFLIAILIWASAGDARAQFYGPFDYTNPVHYREKLPIVEQYHFNRDIESLRATMPGGSIGDHLWYVIRSFPNHHRALISMEKLWDQYQRKGETPPGVDPEKTPEFLYRRAIDFAPQDGVVNLLYGIFLIRQDKTDEAIGYLELADKLEPDNAEVQYNLGLMYMKVDDMDRALEHAHRAYSMNYPLAGLRNKLTREGVWQDPTDAGEK